MVTSVRHGTPQTGVLTHVMVLAIGVIFQQRTGLETVLPVDVYHSNLIHPLTSILTQHAKAQMAHVMGQVIALSAGRSTTLLNGHPQQTCAELSPLKYTDLAIDAVQVQL